MQERDGGGPASLMTAAAVSAAVSGILSAFLFFGYLSAGEITGLVLATVSCLLLAAAAFRYRADPLRVRGAVVLSAIVRGIVLAINAWNLVFFVNNVHSISGSLAKRDFIEPAGNFLIFAAFLILAMTFYGKIRTRLPGGFLLGALFLFEIARILFVYRTWDSDMNLLSRGDFWKEIGFYHLPVLLSAVSSAFLLKAVPLARKTDKSTGK